MDFYAERLSTGALSHEQVVPDFCNSPEHVALTASNIVSDAPSRFGILFT